MKQYAIKLKEYIWPRLPFILLGVFLILFFGKIAVNGYYHKKYVNEFNAACESAGGISRTVSGVKGWPMPECFKKESVIIIDRAKR